MRVVRLGSDEFTSLPRIKKNKEEGVWPNLNRLNFGSSTTHTFLSDYLDRPLCLANFDTTTKEVRNFLLSRERIQDIHAFCGDLKPSYLCFT